MKLYMFRTVPLSIIRSFSLYTHQWYIHTGLLTACEQDHDDPACKLSKNLYEYTIGVCTVKSSWLWTEELSEICRVLFQE